MDMTFFEAQAQAENLSREIRIEPVSDQVSDMIEEALANEEVLVLPEGFFFCDKFSDDCNSQAPFWLDHAAHSGVLFEELSDSGRIRIQAMFTSGFGQLIVWRVVKSA